MTKVFIRENISQPPEREGQKILSFVSGPADFYPENFITQKEVEEVYFRVFTPLMERLFNPVFLKNFEYRGVSLLSCFKKPLFEYAYSIALRYEILRRALEKVPGTFIFDSGSHAEVPFFCEYFHSTSLEQSSRLEVPQLPNMPKQSIFSPAAPRRGLSWGAWKKAKVAIYSDPRKSRAILNRLKPDVFVFLNEPAPRVMLKAFFENVPVYLTARPAHAPEVEQELLKLLEESLLFEKLSLHEIDFSEILKAKLKALFLKHLSGLLTSIDGFHHFFDQSKSLRSVLLDEDISREKNAFSQIARSRGVAPIVECHGSLGHRSGYLPLTAAGILVWGQKQKEKFIRWGCPENRVMVTGCSRYETYQAIDKVAAKNKMVSSLGFDAKCPLVLVAFPPVNHGRIIFENQVRLRIAETLKALAEMAVKFPESQWVIKLHPGDENRPAYEAWLIANPSIQSRIRLLQKEDPLFLARAVDFLIVYWSTYAPDGFALEKPVISLFDQTDDSLEEYREFHVFHYANDIGMMKRICAELLRGRHMRPPGWDQARRDCLNETGIPASQQTAQVLLNPTFSLTSDAFISDQKLWQPAKTF